MPRALGYVLVFALLTSGAIDSFAARPHTFPTAQRARKHCPRDTVVWLNLQSSIYYFRGEHYYGRTRVGAYVCKKEADRAGHHARADPDEDQYF